MSAADAYAQRYAPNWPTISARAIDLLEGYCSYPGCWCRARATHHACYLKTVEEKDDRGIVVYTYLAAVAGEEIAGAHVFPLCRRHHSETDPTGAHHPDNWIKGKEPPPSLDARNTADYYRLLRQGWTEKRQWAKRYREQPSSTPLSSKQRRPRKRRAIA